MTRNKKKENEENEEGRGEGVGIKLIGLKISLCMYSICGEEYK